MGHHIPRKEGFVLDVKINEFVKYGYRYESSYLTKVKKQVHTFNWPLEEGELVAYADGDHYGPSQLAEYGIKSQQRVCSDVEMVQAESSLNDASRNVWNGMVANSEPINAREVNERFGEQ